jgi:hypothetical protein
VTSTWYPPTTYDPAAGTGQLLCNPPFAAMTDPDLIETACHNACQAMHRESERAHREQQSPETCLILAAALEVLLTQGIETYDGFRACHDHLLRSASPRRAS